MGLKFLDKKGGKHSQGALYSGDNNNLVVVVQQLYNEDPTTGVLLWDDSDLYRAYHFDFVDNYNYATPH